jgi:FkbM family methyltransferase
MTTVLFGLWTGPSGRVIAYEALPWNADVVRQNVILNGLNNVEVRAVGAGDRAQRFTASSNQHNIVVRQAGLVRSEGSDKVEVQLVPLDDDLGRGAKPNFLKVDVEGGDLQALRGARRLLRSRPTVDLELHNFLFEDRTKSCLRSFRSTGSTWTGVPDLDWLATLDNPHVCCIPRTRD